MLFPECAYTCSRGPRALKCCSLVVRILTRARALSVPWYVHMLHAGRALGNAVTWYVHMLTRARALGNAVTWYVHILTRLYTEMLCEDCFRHSEIQLLNSVTNHLLVLLFCFNLILGLIVPSLE